MDNEPKIEKGIPVPSTRMKDFDTYKAFLEKLGVGDSFEIESTSWAEMQRKNGKFHAASRHLHMRITTRSNSMTFKTRIWRIE